MDFDCIVQRELNDAVGRMARGYGSCEEYRAEMSLILDMTIGLMARVLHIFCDRSLISPESAESIEYTHEGVAGQHDRQVQDCKECQRAASGQGGGEEGFGQARASNFWLAPLSTRVPAPRLSHAKQRTSGLRSSQRPHTNAYHPFSASLLHTSSSATTPPTTSILLHPIDILIHPPPTRIPADLSRD